MKFRELVALGLILLGGAGPGLAYGEETILIVRPLSNSKVDIDTTDYLFEVEVSAFEPLETVSINGESQTLPAAADWVVLKKRITLVEGKNVVTVEGQTASAIVTKQFPIFYDPQKIGYSKLDAGRTFTLVGVFGGQYATNPARLEKDTPGLKLVAMFVPRYKHPLDPATLLQVDGLIYRDKYNDKKFEWLDSAITEVKVSQVNTLSASESWQFGGGYGLYANQFDNPLQYKYKQHSDLFLSGAFTQGQDESGSRTYEGEYRKISYDQGPNITALSVMGRMGEQVGMFRGKFHGKYKQEKADQGSQDSTTVELGAGLTTPLAQLMDSGGEGAPWDVGAGLRLASIKGGSNFKISRTTLLLNARQQLSPKSFFLVELSNENQSSNIPGYGYGNTALSAYYITTVF
ncbi:MAG: hypothetical protein OEW39_04105 [Deltaproteobacteria bacterium]|nr:hypothetical protein [Deltaproteobacteria bacterium]